MTTDEHLGIVELVGICDELRRENEALFVLLGGWVGTTGEPCAQQLFAEACHRHAWHAELWGARRPAIGQDGQDGQDTQHPDGESPSDVSQRIDRYHTALTRIRNRNGELRERTDAVLDPSTVRVFDLVDADVEALLGRIAALG